MDMAPWHAEGTRSNSLYFPDMRATVLVTINLDEFDRFVAETAPLLAE